MIDRRFYAPAVPLTLAEIAAITGAVAAQGTDPTRSFHGTAPLRVATPQDVSFLASARMLGALRRSQAGACFVTAEMALHIPAPCAALICADPQAAFVALARWMHPDPVAQGRIDPRAVIAADARIGPGCEIAAGAVIGSGAVVGEASIIGPNAVIGAGVVLGAGCAIGANAAISHALIGARVVIHPGAVIGSPGFGFIAGAAGLTRIPQLGRVILGDDVEVGANTTIDRGAGEDTVIGRGTKIDNLVQIGHNCKIGKHCIIVAQVGLSGSVTLGDGVVLGGQVGVADHMTIGNGARLAAKSGVTREVPARATFSGLPAQDIGQWRREIITLRNLARADRDGKKP